MTRSRSTPWGSTPTEAEQNQTLCVEFSPARQLPEPGGSLTGTTNGRSPATYLAVKHIPGSPAISMLLQYSAHNISNAVFSLLHLFPLYVSCTYQLRLKQVTRRINAPRSYMSYRVSGAHGRSPALLLQSVFERTNGICALRSSNKYP